MALLCVLYLLLDAQFISAGANTDLDNNTTFSAFDTEGGVPWDFSYTPQAQAMLALPFAFPTQTTSGPSPSCLKEA